MSSQTLLELSHAQMGRGVALRQTTTLTQLATTIPIGTSPAEGTGCTLYLNTQNDPAYDNATVTFIVQIEGKQVVYNTQTIAPSDNAAYQALEYTTSGCASDVWHIGRGVLERLIRRVVRRCDRLGVVDDLFAFNLHDEGDVRDSSANVHPAPPARGPIVRRPRAASAARRPSLPRERARVRFGAS